MGPNHAGGVYLRVTTTKYSVSTIVLVLLPAKHAPVRR